MKTNIIYNEECLRGMKKRIPDNSIDMILADLPYGTTACKWDSIISLDKLWKQYKRIIKDRVAIVLTASQPFTTKLISGNMEWFRYEWIWEKDQGTNFLMSKKQPLKKHENILIFYNKQPVYNPQFTDKGSKWTKKNTGNTFTEYLGRMEEPIYKESKGTKRYPTTTDLHYNTPKQNGEHPTQKPVALFEYLIKTYTNEGDIVLDNVIGSGTTAVACLKTNRQFIGFEIEEKYYNIALKRIGKFDKKYYEELPDKERPIQQQLF